MACKRRALQRRFPIREGVGVAAGCAIGFHLAKQQVGAGAGEGAAIRSQDRIALARRQLRDLIPQPGVIEIKSVDELSRRRASC